MSAQDTGKASSPTGVPKKTLQEHPLLSDKYRYYTEQELRYDAASTLMQRRFSVDRNKQEHLEDEFMNYIDSAFYHIQYILILFSEGIIHSWEITLVISTTQLHHPTA